MWSLERELALMMRRSYKREELLALQETGKKAVTDQQQEPWVEKILAALEFFADDFYEMEKNNNGQVKSRHRNADRRQRGARGVAKSWDRGLDHQACEVGQEQGVTATAAGWSHNNNKGGGAAAVVERAEVDEEEEEEEEEDSEEDVDSFQPRAFAVEGEPDFASGPPQDGWEYLRRVRQVWEASMIVAARWVSVVALGFRNSEF
jgi:survival of motor neuron protein-interacting protein 1